MKKLMFMLAAVAMAASVHAASVTWSTVAMYNAEGSKVKATATMYVYLLDKTTYDGLTDVWATYGTGDDMKYYAEKATVTTGDDGNGSFSIGLGKLDSATAAANNWQTAAVPEPTSGLLMLVGLAGLALRRKRA